jgi:hypothetical protein
MIQVGAGIISYAPWPFLPLFQIKKRLTGPQTLNPTPKIVNFSKITPTFLGETFTVSIISTVRGNLEMMCHRPCCISYLFDVATFFVVAAQIKK